MSEQLPHRPPNHDYPLDVTGWLPEQWLGVKVSEPFVGYPVGILCPPVGILCPPVSLPCSPVGQL